MEDFDYYIFIDYSEEYLGYAIINSKEISKLIPKITKFKHYKTSKYRKLYLKYIKESIERNNIKDFFIKIKIKEVRLTLEIFTDVMEFINSNQNCIIFISVDDTQFSNFEKLVKISQINKVVIKKESELKIGSSAYQVSLVLDNLLNIERRKLCLNNKK